MLSFIKVLLTKAENGQLIESIVPMKPKQLTQGEFQLMLLRGFLSDLKIDKAISINELESFLSLYKWLRTSYFFPKRNSFFNETTNLLKSYLEENYPNHPFLLELK